MVLRPKNVSAAQILAYLGSSFHTTKANYLAMAIEGGGNVVGLHGNEWGCLRGASIFY